MFVCAHPPKFNNRDLWRRKCNDLEQNLIFYFSLFELLQKAELVVLVFVCNLII